MMRIDRVLVAAALVWLLTEPVAQATGFGINAHIPSDRVADRIEAAGIEWVRVDVLWLLIEPERDQYEWTIYDDLIDRLEARGLKIYAGIGATPVWATSGPEFSGVPDDVDQWREFCYLLARRYAGRVDAWGVWNEPNLDRFWDGSRQEYIDTILIPGAEAIEIGDPSALVCAPDLAHLSSRDWDDWLKATIRAAGDLLDVVTHHVYPSNGWAFEVTVDLEEGGPFPFSPPSVKEVLQDAGWWRRPFWLTETGVESDRWGENRQANFVEDLLPEWFAPSRDDRSWVDRIFFYEMNDGPSPSDYSFGLLYGAPDFDAKLAYSAYVDFIDSALVDDSRLVEATAPRFFLYDEPATASIVLQNTGTTPWSVDQLSFLRAETDTPGWTVETDQIATSETVEPGEKRDFKMVIRPPAAPFGGAGETAIMSVRMERDGAWPFGELFRQELTVADESPPSIISDPSSAVIVAGASTTLRVEADGDPPLSYRWLRNGVELSDNDLFTGAESTTLTVTALSHEVTALYQCVVSNNVGDTISDTAAVVVGQPGPRQGGDRVSPGQTPLSPIIDLDRVRLSGPRKWH